LNKILWTPNATTPTNLDAFTANINKTYNLSLKTYQELYKWSVDENETFWKEIWGFTKIKAKEDYTSVLKQPNKLPGAVWFEGAQLNFAENCLKKRDDSIAISSISEEHPLTQISYKELYDQVSKMAMYLRSIGIKKNDRVAAIVSNSPEAIISFLAVSSVGAIWSSCSPDFGVNGILDRFTQIQPKVLVAVNGAMYNGKQFEISSKIKDVLADLDCVTHLVLIPFLASGKSSDDFEKCTSWNSIMKADPSEIQFEQLPFNHPLYILYSSGTTGTPKSIVHSAGGSLIQHQKEHQLHCNLNDESTLFYYTTCGWMMWNWLVSSLATGVHLVLFDGSPFYPDYYTCWKLIDILKITHFGTSAKFIASSQKENLNPKENLNLDSLKVLLSTGSPLLEENFDYVYKNIKSDIQLSSISGGTDIVSCFALGSPTLPVYRGELQCRGLGMAVEAFNDDGESVINERGELVCTKPFPSMPVSFWNDIGNKKYHQSYFNKFDGVWCQGDFLEINDHGGVKILGRSDSTLNPGGVRIGTAEIYRVVENLDAVKDSLVIGQKVGDDEVIVLFVIVQEGHSFNDELIGSIKKELRSKCSPRHVPKHIYKVTAIPYTKTGKKVELIIKSLFNTGEKLSNKTALSNPESLLEYELICENK
jgi:acetoacetyl-CoA synthetase